MSNLKIKKKFSTAKIVEAGRRSIISNDLRKIFLKHLSYLRLSEINKNMV